MLEEDNLNKERTLKLLQSMATIEWGGHKLYDGKNDHLQQNPREFVKFLEGLISLKKLKNLDFSNFLEIGFHNGYTNTIIDKIFKFKNNVVVDLVDQPGNAEAFRANHRFKNLTMICGASTSTHVVEQAKKLGPYDLIFLDGCHEEYYVNEDYNNYKKMLSEDGVFVFHDINSPRFKGVAKVWNQAKEDYKEFYEFFVPNGNMSCGIGFIVNS